MTVLEGKVEGQPPSAEDREEVRRRIRECGELFNPADVRDFTNDDIFFDRYIYIYVCCTPDTWGYSRPAISAIWTFAK
jgi:hypothetical protein